MTKQELLEAIAEIPEDAEILAYHITTKTEDGQNMRGGITASGNRAILHTMSVMKHVAGCIGLEIEDVSQIIGMYNRWKVRRENHSEKGETIEIRADLLEKLMGGPKDDQ